MGQKVHPRTAGWKSKYFEKKSKDNGSHIAKNINIRKFVVHFLKNLGLKVHFCKLGYLTEQLNIFVGYTKNNKLFDGALMYPRKRRKVKKYRFQLKRAKIKAKLTKKLLKIKGTIKAKLTKKLLKIKAIKAKIKAFKAKIRAIRTKIRAIRAKLSKKLLKTCFKKLIFTLILHSAFQSARLLISSNPTYKIPLSYQKEQLMLITGGSDTPVKKLENKRMSTGALNWGGYALISLFTKSSNTTKKYFFSKLYLNLFKVALKKSFLFIKTSNILQKKLNHKGKQKTKCNYKFTKVFFKSFTFFLSQNLKISLILKCLNKNLKRALPKASIRTLSKKASSISRFNRNKFFNEGANLMFLMSSKKELAEILASYITTSIKNFKKHKLFLKFIKKGLYCFAKRQSTVIKAIKIQLKGRINGADRARSYVIKVGKRVSLLTLGSRINYFESTAFTPDGTLSVKVWVRYYKKLNQFRSKKSIKVNNAYFTTKNKIQKNKKREISKT
jgi:Ribosomal protein S3, C-terminal domain